ncbi:MAG: hypothetical protein V2I33_06515, partial [Kangiellaceae bacterium]|nr:hypothetical protein [Kangiellaceae bacterium]
MAAQFSNALGPKGNQVRSEFQYFMSEKDHSIFDEYIHSFPGVSIKKGGSYDEIILLDGFIQYERSMFSNGVLTS